MRQLIPGNRYKFSPPYGSAEILIWSLTYQEKGEFAFVTEWRFITDEREDPPELIHERPTNWSEMVSALMGCYPGETEETLERRMTLAPVSAA